jgi:hypothetical protein
MHVVALRESEISDFIRQGLSFLMCAKASMHMPGILKVLGQVTLVAKQRNPVD